jgi:hypothetical protein
MANERSQKESLLKTGLGFLFSKDNIEKLSVAIAAASLVEVFKFDPIQLTLTKTATYVHNLIAAYANDIAVQIVVVIGTLFMGNVLYAFRCRKPSWYGGVELFFALATALFVANQIYYNLQTVNPYFVALFSWSAALYVYVRGMDNIYKSFKKGSAWKPKWERTYFGEVLPQQAAARD